jgi:Ca2+-dependent lipid-binding protein
MGVPKVQAGCTPMIEKGVNILNLPVISNFVNWAIGAAASMVIHLHFMIRNLEAVY